MSEPGAGIAWHGRPGPPRPDADALARVAELAPAYAATAVRERAARVPQRPAVRAARPGAGADAAGAAPRLLRQLRLALLRRDALGAGPAAPAGVDPGRGAGRARRAPGAGAAAGRDRVPRGQPRLLPAVRARLGADAGRGGRAGRRARARAGPRRCARWPRRSRRTCCPGCRTRRTRSGPAGTSTAPSGCGWRCRGRSGGPPPGTARCWPRSSGRPSGGSWPTATTRRPGSRPAPTSCPRRCARPS